MSRVCSLLAACLLVWPLWGRLTSASGAFAADARSESPASPSRKSGVWHTDYAGAMEIAEREGRMLLLFFYDSSEKRLCDKFESETLTHPSLAARLSYVVKAKLPLDATIRVGGEEVVLLEHAAFAGMSGGPGVAIIDFFHKDAERHGRVVTTVPLKDDRLCTVGDLAVLHELPSDEAGRRAGVPGELPAEQTQRPRPDSRRRQKLFWYENYGHALRVARLERKMLLIYFHALEENEDLDRFERETLTDPQIVGELEKVVRVKLPVNTEIRLEDGKVRLLEHSAFAEMQGCAGVAIIDFVHEEAPQYGCVVSTFPFLNDRPYTVDQMAVILDLPPGTLTQRTLIFAVRTHPDRPASAEGELNPDLVEEAESHSQRQADIRRQGHHQWERRFHRIRRKLPRGLTATEVCAESWPGEGLLQAAIECVRCWRLSSGHWRAVRSRHRCYGYDMKRGSNGVWYATGIFGGKD